MTNSLKWFLQTNKTVFHLYIMCILFVAIALQTLHFKIYYLQPTDVSIVWSVVDWSVWFALFYVFFIYGKVKIEKDKIRSYFFLAGLVLVIPIFQVIFSTLLFKMIYGLSRPFVDDVIHLLSKRWYQNLFIFGSLFLLFKYLIEKYLSVKTINNIINLVKTKIVLNDGKKIYHLLPEDIYWLEAAKNYVVVKIAEKQILIRSTLKSIEEKLTPNHFLRISRSAIINMNNIYALEKEDKNNLIIITKHKDQFKVGKTYQKEIIELIETGNLHPA